MTYRIDKLKAEKFAWQESTDHEWMFHPGAVTFIRALMGGKELYVETAPINESVLEIVFDIDGLKNAIKPLQQACHWQ